MTRDDLREHVDNLHQVLNRKIDDLWVCDDPKRREDLLRTTKALRGRIEELDEMVNNRRRN